MTTLRRAVPEFTSLALVIATVAPGLILAPALPERAIVGWHVGLDGNVSLTRGPRLLALTALPAVTVVAYAGLRATRLALDRSAARGFEVLAHLTLAALALGQAWVLAANL